MSGGLAEPLRGEQRPAVLLDGCDQSPSRNVYAPCIHPASHVGWILLGRKGTAPVVSPRAGGKTSPTVLAGRLGWTKRSTAAPGVVENDHSKMNDR